MSSFGLNSAMNQRTSPFLRSLTLPWSPFRTFSKLMIM